MFESRLTLELFGAVYQEHDADQVRTLARIGGLPPLALQTPQRGHELVEQLIEIHLDASIENKVGAVLQAVQSYLNDDAHSVASRPKPDTFLSDHPYAYSVGSPQFAGLTWASQCLKIALLEIVVKATSDA